MIKTLYIVGIEGKFLNLIKSIYRKPISNILYNGERMHTFPLKLGTRQDVHSHLFYPIFYWQF